MDYIFQAKSNVYENIDHFFEEIYDLFERRKKKEEDLYSFLSQESKYHSLKTVLNHLREEKKRIDESRSIMDNFDFISIHDKKDVLSKKIQQIEKEVASMTSQEENIEKTKKDLEQLKTLDEELFAKWSVLEMNEDNLTFKIDDKTITALYWLLKEKREQFSDFHQIVFNHRSSFFSLKTIICSCTAFTYFVCRYIWK